MGAVLEGIPNSGGAAQVSYSELNAALCHALFTGEMANRPVYLELTEEVQNSVSKELNIQPNDLEDIVFESVNSQLHGSDQPTLFDSMENSLSEWSRKSKLAADNSTDIPDYPHIPLLLAFTISAADMGNEGGYSTNAYYPRLQGNLGLEDKKILEESYRKVALTFWSGLNLWLDKYLNSKRGIGTAYSISAHRYVGLALSQALVRSVDRKKFPKLFRENSISPYASMVERDMQNVIDAWMKTEDSYYGSYRHPSKPLKRLWEKDDAKARIANIACRELELWDGSVNTNHIEEGQITKLDFLVRLEVFETSFPNPTMQFNFSFTAPISTSEINHIGIKRREGEDDARIEVKMDHSGWWRPDTSFSPIGAIDLLEGLLTLDIGRTFTIERYPKRLAVFRYDELSRIFHEVERVEIGNRTILAIQDNGDFVSKVSAVLSKCARPGWRILNARDLNGIPQGWSMATNVELVIPPDNSFLPPDGSLEALKPTFAGALNFSGGLQLPGRPPKWHSGSEFEIRASVLGAEKISIQICVENEIDQVILQHDFSEATGIWKVNPSRLEDENYIVKLFTDDEKKPVTEKILRLRSSDSLDEANWKSSDRLVHDFTHSSIGAIQSVQLHESVFTFIDGAITKTASNAHFYLQEVPAGERIWWLANPTGNIIARQFEQISLQSVTSASCFGTARHNFVYPPALPSKTRQGFQKSESGQIEGTCKYCGLNKKAAANPWVAEKKKIKKEAAAAKNTIIGTEPVPIQRPHITLSAILPMESKQISLASVLDGLMHIGSGTGNTLDLLASSIDSGALFKYQFSHELDQLGYIDCKIDDYFQVQSWEVTPSSIVSCGDYQVVTGFHSKKILETIRTHLVSGELLDGQKAKTFSLPRIKGATEIEIVALADKLDIPYLKDSVMAMLNLLPPIEELVQNIPSKSVPGFDSISRFEPNSNSWIETSNLAQPGGFRIRGQYRNRYVVRTDKDLLNNSVRYVSAEFAKHFQAALKGRALMAYDYASSQLIVPLGASLPGLYGRAAVLASGQLPERDSSGKSLIYNKIDSRMARLLVAKFGGSFT